MKKDKPNAWDPNEDLKDEAEDKRPKWFHVFRERIDDIPQAAEVYAQVWMPPYREDIVDFTRVSFAIDPGEEKIILQKIKKIIDDFGLRIVKLTYTVSKGFLFVSGEMQVDKVAMLEKRVLLKREKYTIHKARKPRAKKPSPCDNCYVREECLPPHGTIPKECRKEKHPVTEAEVREMIKRGEVEE